jgi:hypothetical protein
MTQNIPMTRESFDLNAMIERFRERAELVKKRGVPPVEGPDRQRFIEQAKLDFLDYSLLSDAVVSVEDDGTINLRIAPRA